MSLNAAIVIDPPGLRRFRRCAPLALVVGLTALLVIPGIVAGDRPHAVSFCPLEQAEACAQLRQALAIGVIPIHD